MVRSGGRLRGVGFLAVDSQLHVELEPSSVSLEEDEINVPIALNAFRDKLL